MKKIMKLFVLVAAAAMTLASCQKNEITGPVKKEVNFTIKADMAETKTAITDKGDGTYRPTWEGGDKIAVLFSEPTKDCNKDAEFVNANEDGAIAQFEGKHTFETEEGVKEVEGTLYAFYPSSAFKKGYQDGTVRLDLPAVQNPTSTSFDPACDLLVAKPCYYYAAADGDAYDVLVDDMYFARLISVLRINLNSDFLEDEIVKSVSFDADGLRLTGAMAVDPIEGVLVKNNSTTDLSEVQALYTETDPIAVSGEKNSAYLVVAPVTIPSGTTLTFTIETENYDIVKTVSAPSDMIMPAGNIAVINLNIKEEDCAAKTEDTSDFSGEWLIVNTDLTKAASKWVDGKNNLSSVELTSIEGVVYESDNLADCKMTITKVTEGENAGCYTIQDASNRYLYAASASANRLNARQDASYWDITEEDGIYTIKSKENTTRNWMRFNNSDNIFNCYSSGQQDITLYKYSDIKVDTTPSISLTKNSDQVAFDATSYEFTYTVKNITGNVAAAIKEGATMTNVSASASNGTVTVTFDANADAEQKTATIVLSYEGAASQEFELTQGGKPASGTVVDVLTRATTGVNSGAGYSSWSGKTVTSSAVYAGQSAGGNDAIQLRTTNSNSGIVTTTSGGKVKKIKVTWQSSTTSGRTLDIYGKNTAYSAATDLYNANTQGTNLGSIKYGTSAELEISGDYEYIGFKSNSGALYLTDVEITWETSGSGGEVTPDPTPDPEPEQPGQGGSGEPTTYTYTFTSKAWADDTNSWTSGKDGNQMTSGRGVQVTTGTSGAYANGKSSMNNVSKVVVVYSTNASAGAGSIEMSIGSTKISNSVTKTGGTTDRELEFDFSSSCPSGVPKITVTCTTNSIYVKSIAITAN